MSGATTMLPNWVRRPWFRRSLALAVALVYPLIAPQDMISVGFIALQYVLFALGLNIVVGWTGLLDLGAAGFVAVGAYITAICLTQLHWPVTAVLPAAIVGGLLAGILLGIPTLRHRADYFAILTLGFAELVALSIRNWVAVTRGPYGYSGIPAIKLPFLNEPLRAFPPTGFYYLALAVAAPAYCAVRWLRATRWGRHCHVVQLHENVGLAYGINVIAVKLLAFGLSAALLAAGGFFWAAYQRSIVVSEFGVVLSCLLLSLLIIGGVGNPRGAAVGAIIAGSSLELLRRLLTIWHLPQDIRFLIFSSAMIIFVHWRPRGILPDKPAWLQDDLSRAASVPRHVPLTPEASSDDSTGPCLQLDDLCRSFGGVKAVDGVCLAIDAGECVALVGPNGSGKTTLLNLISGLLRPDRGTIVLHGRRIERRRAYAIARACVGRSFQEISVFDSISVRDNVYLTASNVTPGQVAAAHRRFGIVNGSQLCQSLSYGAKKALDLARLFVDTGRWRLVLLDEPTAGLTHAEAMELVTVLGALRRDAGMTMIIVSHDVAFLEALSVDRVIVMHQGRVLVEGSFAAVRRDRQVAQLFWGEEGLYS